MGQGAQSLPGRVLMPLEFKYVLHACLQGHGQALTQLSAMDPKLGLPDITSTLCLHIPHQRPLYNEPEFPGVLSPGWESP